MGEEWRQQEGRSGAAGGEEWRATWGRSGGQHEPRVEGSREA